MTTKHFYAGHQGDLVEGYLLVGVGAGANPLELLNGLAGEALVGWDAVRDSRYRLLLHLHGRDRTELEQAVAALATAHPEMGERELVVCGQPALDDGSLRRIGDYEAAEASAAHARMPGTAHCWLLLDTAPGALGPVYSALYTMEEVVVVESELAGRRLLALVQTPDFESLGRTVRDRILPLAGVVRLLELKVVERDDMEE